MSGEEAFVVGLDGTGAVWLTVTGFPRPASALTRPLARRHQQRITAAYLRGLDHPPPGIRPDAGWEHGGPES